MFEIIRRICRCEEGATAVEYGLIAALIVIAVMAAMSNLGNSTSNMWNGVANTILNVSK
jgi:pilus assembly protein Flp/PilA